MHSFLRRFLRGHFLHGDAIIVFPLIPVFRKAQPGNYFHPGFAFTLMDTLFRVAKRKAFQIKKIKLYGQSSLDRSKQMVYSFDNPLIYDISYDVGHFLRFIGCICSASTKNSRSTVLRFTIQFALRCPSAVSLVAQ